MNLDDRYSAPPVASRQRWLRVALFAMAGLLIALSQASAADTRREGPESGTPELVTNESNIVEALRPRDGLKVSDPKAVFNYVLASLPARVKVYPTENYYYFTFLHGGVPYAGNVRLDATDRDLGKLHFVYFREQTPWMGKSAVTHLVLDDSHGIFVEKLSHLIYRVKNGVASVVFELNDLSGVTPPREAIVEAEQYLGPVFDESGMRFFLIYNARAKAFHYVLNEAAPMADRLVQTGVSDRIRVGMRTGFAFYADHRAKRNILIGVYAENERLNNHFDGPFDQLPDNFIEGDALRRAILATDPDMAGKIDRLGHYHGQEIRYAITPYIDYGELSDLAAIDDCASAKTANAASYAACFVAGAVDAGQ